MRFKRVLIVCLFFGHLLRGQQPAYFILGENEFRGMKIYDIIQDRKLNYWIATNEGLFYFDHYTYQRVDCNESKSNSVFNFVENKQGIIYCHNLNYQVFRIKDKSCTLFYELAPDEASSDLSLSAAPDGGLYVGGKKIIHLSSQGEVKQRTSLNFYLGPPYTDNRGNVYYQLGGSDSVLVISGKDQTVERKRLKGSPVGKDNVLRFFQFASDWYALDLRTKKLYLFDQQKLQLKQLEQQSTFEPGGATRLYFAGSHVWLAGTLNGVVMLSGDLNPPAALRPFYEDYFISDVYMDKEGNILLGTFDRGILVVPDLDVPDVIRSFKEDPVTALNVDSMGNLFMGTSKGSFMEFRDNDVITLSKPGKRSIEGLYMSEQSPLIFFDNGLVRAFNRKTQKLMEICDASLKDAAIVNESLSYLGTNRGIVKCTNDSEGKIKIEYMREFAFRIYSLAYDPLREKLYASTSHGLFVIALKGGFQKIVYKNSPIYPGSLCYSGGAIYATDKKHGILVIQDEEVKNEITLSSIAEGEVFSKIQVDNEKIIARSFRGLFQFDPQGRLIEALNVSQGFSGSRVIDFSVYKNSLWVCHTSGVQRIDLSRKHRANDKPLLYLADLKLNDSSVHIIPGAIPSTQRKIQFTLCSPTLRSRETIRYHYKLDGVDAQWSVNNSSLNQITYNALSPGSYVFLAKAEKQGVFSEVLSYPFKIEAPFYKRWWFITILTVLIAAGIFSIYKWQLNLQRKKVERVNELNASKLTAIQSQMNPHFIFNSLNSIQNLILKGDVEYSYSYISTFSDLVRRTLSYSDKDFIDFEQEVKLIEIYLSLEQLRFKKDFEYQIEATGISDIQIPPMLIQPFIENALAHGLLHKKGEKKLYIKFELKEDLICTIRDNGVGRERARTIKQRQGSAHESFSVSAIRKRFEILSVIFKGKFGFSYQDLKNEQGQAEGTQVTVVLPTRYKF